jgi:hypothetical protein
MGTAQAADAVTGANRGEITLHINLRSPQLAGEIAVAGHPAAQFDGWLGLLRALDQALQTLDQSRPVNGRLATETQNRDTP